MTDMTPSIRRRRLSLAAAAWCSGCAVAAQPAAAAPQAEGDAARTFRALRTVRGHFEGGPWRDDVDRWQGRKHVAMQALAAEMLRMRATAALLRQTMGEPDGVFEPGQAAHARALEQAQWLKVGDTAAQVKSHTARLWLYRWRGSHDQLVLALTHDRVTAAGWLHDWE